MAIWFTSDLHFGHKKILNFCPNRPFPTVEAMDEGLIERWNKRVHKRDTVYVLGDFAFCSKEQGTAILKRLHGRKVLILGNHDHPARYMLEMGFDEVHENIYVDLGGDPKGPNARRVMLSHFPYRPSFLDWLKAKFSGGYWDSRYMHKRMTNDGFWLLHGHTHSRRKIRNNMLHIGADAWDCCPISHLQVLKAIQEEEAKWSSSATFTGVIKRFLRFWHKSPKTNKSHS